MAALVQTIPQQTSTVPVLQTRPASSSSQQHQHHHHHTARNSSMSWNPYAPAGSSGSYRPNAHQAVTSYNTPNSPNPQNRQSWNPHLRPENRTISAPSAPPLTAHAGGSSHSVNHPAAGPVSSTPPMHLSKDDSVIPTRKSSSQQSVDQPIRPLSTVNLPPPSPLMNISSPTVAKPSPDRYRRGNRRAEGAAGAQSTNASHHPGPSVDDSQLASLPGHPTARGHVRVSSADDTSRPDRPQTELAKRYRRRSWGNMDNAGLINLQLHLPSASPTPSTTGQDYFDQTKPTQNEGSTHSAQSSTSTVRDGDSSSSARGKPDDTRVNKPSPLSQPVSADASPSNPPAPQAAPKERNMPTGPAHSPATQRAAEIANSSAKGPGKSRLRRAFSFGSASELLKASNNAQKKEALSVEKTRRELLNEELGAEQAAIAEQQEASGLGESIYSHYQGHLFNRSNDNLSVSSTASSASVMLRKMGKGMKKSTRSLVGLFRPKSVMSTSSTDGIAVEPSVPQVSMVNIEADRNSVLVNADPHLPRGGTVFPKVEPNSQDAVTGASGASSDGSRKSIVGSDNERAEVLAAVRKGILKKTHSEPALSTPAKSRDANSSESPHSSTPSTPEDRSGNRVKIAGEDYFAESKGAPSPPMAPKSLIFSPRIQLHETWTSGEYDRRGDVATCNRLTPLLAQQIKEELNNFKMEMEVHETSKVYTHFL